MNNCTAMIIWATVERGRGTGAPPGCLLRGGGQNVSLLLREPKNFAPARGGGGGGGRGTRTHFFFRLQTIFQKKNHNGVGVFSWWWPTAELTSKKNTQKQSKIMWGGGGAFPPAPPPPPLEGYMGEQATRSMACWNVGIIFIFIVSRCFTFDPPFSSWFIVIHQTSKDLDAGTEWLWTGGSADFTTWVYYHPNLSISN